MNTVVSYGEIGVDNIILVPHLPSPEKAAFPTSDTYHIGGAAANYAVLLASWDVAVGLTGNSIGQDDLGKYLLGEMRCFKKLDLYHLKVNHSQPSPFCRILVTPNGERSIMVFGYPTTPKTLMTTEMLKGVRFLALDLYGCEERVDAAKMAHAMGVKTIVNDLISLNHPILHYSDIIVNSSAYIRSEYPGVNVVDHAIALHQKYGATVITTNGGENVHAVDQSGNQFVFNPPAVEAVDATGAGDAFRAGLTYGLIQGWGWKRSVQMAIATGSLKVSRVGAVATPPTLDEVLRFSERIFPDFKDN